MTESAVILVSNNSSTQAGLSIGQQVKQKLRGKTPHALIVFASSRYNYSELLKAVDESCAPEILIGCSSAGEFTHQSQEEGAVSAVAIWSDHLKFSAGLGKNLKDQKSQAAAEVTTQFLGLKSHEYRFHTAIVMADALAGYTDDFIQELTLKTQGKYQLIGGGAGDDAQFSKTHVFYGTEAFSDAAVALEILSNEPVGIGVQHGWKTKSSPLRVTEAQGSRLVSINARPAVEIFQEFAEQTGQTFNPADPIPFFLHNIVGIDTKSGHKLRVPLAVNEDGSISCASDIPQGSTIHIMHSSESSAAEAASTAAQTALSQMNGNRPSLALFFDCVATRLRLGGQFRFELQSFSDSLGKTQFVGCNTYGQIARVDGQFSGFHNCTAVTCLLP